MFKILRSALFISFILGSLTYFGLIEFTPKGKQGLQTLKSHAGKTLKKAFNKAFDEAIAQEPAINSSLDFDDLPFK